MTKIVTARRPFLAVVAGKTIRVAPGDLFRADDPLLVGRADKFRPAEIRSTVPVAAEDRSIDVTSAGRSLVSRVRGSGGRFVRTGPSTAT